MITFMIECRERKTTNHEKYVCPMPVNYLKTINKL